MGETHCYVSKAGTKFDEAVKKEWKQSHEWNKVMVAMGVHMGEEIKSMYLTTTLAFPPEVLVKFNADNQKLFKQNGFLKKTGKGTKQLREFFNSILQKFGLDDYQSISDLRFGYGMFRLRGQTSEGYRDFDGRLYMKTDFVPSGATKWLTEISEIDYTEKYADLLKEQDKRKQTA
jgi:hypothetical protein